MRLDNSIPYYRQILEEIQSRIQKGEWGQGDRIPSERELCDQFGVSRITVRQGIRLAVEKGMLSTLPGKGTFVATKKAGKGFIENVTFAELIRGLNKNPKSIILEWETLLPPANNYRLAELFDTRKLVNLVILGLGDDEPLIIYSSFFPYELGIKMVRKAEARLSKGIPFSSFDLYNDDVGVLPRKAQQTYEVVQAVGKRARALRIPQKSPLFLIKSVFYTSNDKPIEYREATYRGDRFIFHVRREF